MQKESFWQCSANTSHPNPSQFTTICVAIGGTNFPALNLTVTPKRGRAALWPSVLNEYPNKKDSRTNHQALPVVEGVKYGGKHIRFFVRIKWFVIAVRKPETTHNATELTRSLLNAKCWLQKIYLANAWIHQRDFKTNSKKGC